MNTLNSLIYLALFQCRVKSKLATFFPVLLNFSLPTVSSNPPLECDPAEMMKEVLPHHTQPKMYCYFHKGVFLAAFSSHARLRTVPAPTSHNNELSAEIEVLTPQFLPPVKTQPCISDDLSRDLDVVINVLTALHLSQGVQWLFPPTSHATI